MSFNRNENLKIVGFFGQSGAGKTTIIRNVAKQINGNTILQNTGIIRYLFRKNNYYLNPKKMINDHFAAVSSMTDEKKKKAKIDELYEKYIRSQLQLLNDWSTELYLASIEKYSRPSILLVDRSPIDFYALTVCGLNVLTEKFDKKLSDMCEYYVKLVRQVAEDNTNNFLNAIFVTRPWTKTDINNLRDGIRDQYLDEAFSGSNWYDRFDEPNLKIRMFVIGEDIKDLQERAKFVNTKLVEV